ncbi:MAG: tRNA preQ1(34) S-adenosylmethionine ribosyltransferase-isomerase QueA [Fretibacterium sp.]|nr:tRNA preQ1(34) S-adenosylmethionine ribosyltransferase-isomerase QueA [Fretibacterium sp.]
MSLPRTERFVSQDALFDLNSYDYSLPEDRIAQTPAEPRDASRLLVWSVGTGDIRHRHFRDIVDYLRPEDLLVLNDTRVLPARLLGTRVPGGGRAEVFLLRPLARQEDGSVGADFSLWQALVRPGRKLHAGAEVRVGDRTLYVEEEEPEGIRRVRISGTDVLAFLNAFGHVPLPPYIHGDGDMWRASYQTVFACREGSVAAPTASLHFTPALLDRIDALGVRRAWVTLHVGLGTFRPVKSQDIRDHVIHEEPCEIPEAAAEAVRECRARGGRVIASGTTVARTLETMAAGDGLIRAGSRDTGLYIYPGFRFQVVDALITNFHLPKSSLLMLVAALAANLDSGREPGGPAEARALSSLLAVYELAVREGYRFFSFGDAMFIQR